MNGSISPADNMINLLLEKGGHKDWYSLVKLEPEIKQLCLLCRDIFLKEPSLLQLKAPINIAGNIYGQYITLLSVFENDGLPPRSKYLFLGNYVDEAGEYLETILLLLALKIKYPEHLFLLRGCFDGVQIFNRLADELEICKNQLMDLFQECLESLPVAALINDKFLCTHGGLSPSLHDLDQIRDIQRPISIPNSGLLSDLLGSGTIMSKKVKLHQDFHYDPSAKELLFLKKLNLHLICCGYKDGRGHEAVDEQRVIFICSASSSLEFCLRSKFPKVGNGAMMSVDEDLMYSFQKLIPQQWFWSKDKYKYAITKSPKFDPTSLYRSKAPGVKRFLGARV